MFKVQRSRFKVQMFKVQMFKVQRSNVQRSSLSLYLVSSKHEREHTVITTFNVPTFNLQPSNLQPPSAQPSNLQTFKPSTFNLQPSTFNLQPSTFNLQLSTFNLQPFNLSTLQPSSPHTRSHTSRLIQRHTWRVSPPCAHHSSTA